ncbi:MAG: linalool dehydratase/isomerase domain-containing protein [Candidatus Thorarchaeota archaeon]
MQTRNNKFVIVSFLFVLILGGVTFSNLPGSSPVMGIQTIGGVTYNFSDYQSVDKEQLALFNYLDTIVTQQPYGSWDGWNAEDFHGQLHYVVAFMDYAMTMLFETTSGYRTEYYRGVAEALIQKMNTSYSDWGINSVEYTEWLHPEYDFVDYHYPNATDPNDLYVGGYRGPANIMWTGHYALMLELYERNFNAGLFNDDVAWFIDDWNNSLNTDGFGIPQEGGIWKIGLIPCEPYIMFVQCNSIPIFLTELWDNTHGTEYMPMWDYGLEFLNREMMDEHGLYTDGYYLVDPTGHQYSGAGTPDTFPGHAMDMYLDDGSPKMSAYGTSWSLTFLEYTQPEASIEDYSTFLNLFGKDVSGSQMYMADSYSAQGEFGQYDMLASLFTLALAKQRGDDVTVQRLMNFLFNMYNQVWSEDGRTMHYDTMALEPFMQPVLAIGKILAKTPVTIRDLATPRTSEFWNYPFIGSADDDRIWVYQALYDADNSAFILNIEVEETATLTFSNFNSQPTAYSNGRPLFDLSEAGTDYILTLDPGTYNLVII